MNGFDINEAREGLKRYNEVKNPGAAAAAEREFWANAERQEAQMREDMDNTFRSFKKAALIGGGLHIAGKVVKAALVVGGLYLVGSFIKSKMD